MLLKPYLFDEKPTESSRPWDKNRDGFVMGEGAGIIVPECLFTKKGHIFMLNVGYECQDGHHITVLLKMEMVDIGL